MATHPVIRIIPPYTPELLSSAQESIEKFIESVKKLHPERRPRVLEFGSGWSTIWFAQMGCYILSVEHSYEWYHEVKDTLIDIGYNLRKSASLLFTPEQSDIRKTLDLLTSSHTLQSLDLIYVDCIDDRRLMCVESTLPLLREGGRMVVDDTHWPSLAAVFDMMKGWDRETIYGMHTRKTGEVCYHHTSIFTKPIVSSKQ